MTDIASAAATALRDAGPYVLVTGRPTPGIAPLVAGAQRHVISPGPTTRLAVAAGVTAGGHRGVAVLDAGCAFADGQGDLAVTESLVAAREALRAGWSLVQPSRGADLLALLEQAPRPAVVVLGEAPGPDAAADRIPPAAAVRVWREGDLGTLAAAGGAVSRLVRIGERLHARGVSVAVVEVATLTDPRLGPLIGGDALYVGGADARTVLRDGGWPDPMARIALGDADDADLVGRVLSHIRTA